MRAPLGGLTVRESPTANELDARPAGGRFTSRTRESVLKPAGSTESDDDVGRVLHSGESSGLGHVTLRPCEVLVHLFFAAGADTLNLIKPQDCSRR